MCYSASREVSLKECAQPKISIIFFHQDRYNAKIIAVILIHSSGSVSARVDAAQGGHAVLLLPRASLAVQNGRPPFNFCC